MEPKLPELFGLLPRSKLIVTNVPSYMEKESSTQYVPGTPDGSRAGQIWVDTYDYATHDMLDDEATAYHEGVPGHHMQISIAQELAWTSPLSPRSRTDNYNAYVEGWALYAERLGKEVGFYRIRRAIWVACVANCIARCASWWTPESMTSAGRASRWLTTGICTCRRHPTLKWTAILPGPVRRWATSWAS